jgi:uncharacterized membrane protein
MARDESRDDDRRDVRRSKARLDIPRDTRRSLVRRPHYDPDTFGNFAETFARFMGTAKFLAYMSSSGWQSTSSASSACSGTPTRSSC